MACKVCDRKSRLSTDSKPICHHWYNVLSLQITNKTMKTYTMSYCEKCDVLYKDPEEWKCPDCWETSNIEAEVKIISKEKVEY